jgi:PAS domain S-box-containing protein
VQDRECLEREVDHLRRRIAHLERELALYSRVEPSSALPSGLEVSLEEREELLIAAERIAHLGTWLWSLEDNQVYWSEEQFRLLGYDPASDRASTEAFFAAVHPDDRERVRAASGEAVASGVVRQIDCRVLTRDGTLRYITMDAACLFDDQGRLRRVFGTVLDITHIRTLQEKLAQAEKMEAIGRLAAGVAHDFNNVLTVVRGNLDLSSLPASHEMKQVFSALESAADLTSKLLTLGRRSPLRRRTVDLSVLVRKTVGLVERMLREQITLQVHVPDTALLVDVDETLIEQALVNLLLNARDALPDGGNVGVTARALEEEGRKYVELLVSDDGPGMSDATKTRVFEPFFTTKEDSSGHGLGLAMVHGTVAQHGGTVVVESSRGRGTRFRLRFPRI